MLSRTTFYSNLNPALQKLRELNWDIGVEQGSKAAEYLRRNTRNEFLSNRTHYKTEYVIGKKGKNKGKLVKRITKTASTRRFGKIVDPTGRFKVDLQNLMQYVSYPKTGTTVFMGLQKAGSARVPRNGGTKTVRWGHVGQDSIFIFDKLNSGKVGKAKWRGKDGLKSSEPMDMFKNARYPATKFADIARARAMPQIQKLITKGHSQILEKRASKIKPKMEKVG